VFRTVDPKVEGSSSVGLVFVKLCEITTYRAFSAPSDRAKRGILPGIVAGICCKPNGTDKLSYYFID